MSSVSSSDPTHRSTKQSRIAWPPHLPNILKLCHFSHFCYVWLSKTMLCAWYIAFTNYQKISQLFEKKDSNSFLMERRTNKWHYFWGLSYLAHTNEASHIILSSNHPPYLLTEGSSDLVKVNPTELGSCCWRESLGNTSWLKCEVPGIVLFTVSTSGGINFAVTPIIQQKIHHLTT